MLAPLGKSEYCVLSWLVDCDMRRVLMTHIGFVQIVLLAPAMMEDQKLTTKPFSAQVWSALELLLLPTDSQDLPWYWPRNSFVLL